MDMMTLLHRPELVSAITPGDALVLLADLDEHQLRIMGLRSQVMLQVAKILEQLASQPDADEYLSVEEAAAIMGCQPRWLWRHAETLPFCRRVSKKVMRVSRKGLQAWMTPSSQ